MDGGACWFACQVDADCPPSFSCTSEGLCEWTGCAADTDCRGGTICAEADDGSRSCATPCARDADCPGESSLGPFACVGGGCATTGCPSDAWCTDYMQRVEGRDTVRSRCLPDEDGPRCVVLCDSDADCASRVFGNPLRCDAGICVAAGCSSDAQCQAWWGVDPGVLRCVER